MIYCVVPQALADELYDRLVEYYRDDPNVTVIIDRRSRRDDQPPRSGPEAGPPDRAADEDIPARRQRDRPREPGSVDPGSDNSAGPRRA